MTEESVQNVKKEKKLRRVVKLLQKQMNLEVLQKICAASIEELLELNGEVKGVKDQQYSFKDNNSKILAVAHCDSVQNGKAFQKVMLDEETLIFNPRLDDRLGVYTILYMLKQLNINVDILLTEGEEGGKSTAKLFQTEKKYNWMVEFDRTGDDVVLYHYKDWEKEVENHFDVRYGTFSDISALEHLGCCGVNIGVGYYDYHSSRSYFVLEEYLMQLAKFCVFWKKYENTVFPYTKKTHAYPSFYEDDDESNWNGWGWKSNKIDKRITEACCNKKEDKKDQKILTYESDIINITPLNNPTKDTIWICPDESLEFNDDEVLKDSVTGWPRCPVCGQFLDEVCTILQEG